jgi:hypothetical protein
VTQGRSRPALAGITALAVGAVSRKFLVSSFGDDARWQRDNYQGRTVSLLGGPAVAAGTLAGAIVAGSPACGIASLAGAGLGLYDDLWGNAQARGLRGHLRSARSGRLTTGMVKLAGLAIGGSCASAVGRRGTRHTTLSPIVDTVLVAGTANLVNLLDLRPGRAAKAVIAMATPIALLSADGSATAAAGLGAILAVVRSDLGEHMMLGDCGANCAGAVLGWALTTSLTGKLRAGAIGSVLALTLASELVSFSAVIERTAPLAAIDRWGRRVE